jgi:hypothetical protein
MPTAPSEPAPFRGTQLSLSEVLTALSHALDLTEGQPLGHTVRTCLIGMRLAEELGLPVADRSALYYALLLKDAGCSSNAAQMSALFGADDRAIKPRMKVVDWHRRVGLAVETFRCAGLGGGWRDHVRQFLAIARTPDVTRDLIRIRCDRGAQITRKLGFPESTASIVRGLDEHWNGGGHPDGLAGEAIPIGARIANLAQTLETYARTHDTRYAMRVVRARRGTWFDPVLVDHVQRWTRDAAWWAALGAPTRTRPPPRSNPTIAAAPSTTRGSTTSRAPSPRSSTPSRRSPSATPPTSRSSPSGWARPAGWMRRRASGSGAPGCCTTSGSSASRTASSTRTGR